MAKMMESFNPSSSGYQFMWIILAVGIVGLGFAIERFIYIVIRSGKGRAQFLAEFLREIGKCEKQSERL